MSDVPPRIPLLHLELNQVRALSSPVRLAIRNHFFLVGPCGVADVAKRMNRTPESLYHHVRILEDVGLLRRVGIKRVVKRDQAVYDITSTIAIPKPSPWTEEYCKAQIKFYSVVSKSALEDTIATTKALYNKEYLDQVQYLRRRSPNVPPEKVPELVQRLREFMTYLASIETHEGVQVTFFCSLSALANGKDLDAHFADLTKPLGP